MCVEILCCWCVGVPVLPRWNRLAGCERIADRFVFVLADTKLCKLAVVAVYQFWRMPSVSDAALWL